MIEWGWMELGQPRREQLRFLIVGPRFASLSLTTRHPHQSERVPVGSGLTSLQSVSSNGRSRLAQARCLGEDAL